MASWLLFFILLILWLIGFAINWGAFVWLLLVGAAAVLLINLIGTLSGRHWH